MTDGAVAPVWTVRTEVFDGPLDLLLYLVRRDGIDLRLIRIAPIADAYVAYLGQMQDLQLGVAADYLVLAATLCHLKSLEILPRPPTATVVAEDAVDPRAALVRRLVDYQRFREAAEALDARPWLGRDVFAREPADIGDAPRPVAAGVDAFGLLDLYFGLLRRSREPDLVHEVHGDAFDIGTCCRRVLEILGGEGATLDLGAILGVFSTRAERIVAFLAVLEMSRLRWVGLEQREHLGAVSVRSHVGVDVDLQPVVGRLSVAAG